MMRKIIVVADVRERLARQSRVSFSLTSAALETLAMPETHIPFLRIRPCGFDVVHLCSPARGVDFFAAFFYV
jgi:hypothetical protein